MAINRTFRWVCLFALFLSLVTIPETEAAETIYVSQGESIQDAVDTASSGDTILVKPGEYNESVQIDQDNLTIISELNNPYYTVVTGENTESNVFKVAASNVTIRGFSIVDSKCGIYLDGAQNCIINKNNISGNNIGIYLFKSDNNTLSDNLVYSNSDCGINSFASSGNVIQNNYFNNTNNARDNKFNIWNRTSGNYWSDYTGKDEDGDGIGDTVYSVNRRTKNLDYRPLMDSIPQLPVLPEAIFTSNVTVGYAPLTVEFTDFSENASSLLWNLGNLGTSNSSDFLYTFVNEGNYTVTLNVTNENGSDSTFVTINVLKAPNPSVHVLPQAKLSSNVTVGYVPLTVQFFDFSDNAESVSWNFGDGKKSHCSNPHHTFCCPGKYKVSLKAENDNGSSSTCIVINVLEPTNQSYTKNTDSPKNYKDPDSSRRNENIDIERFLNRKSLESVVKSGGNFVLSFTGTLSLAELRPSVEHEILMLLDNANDFIKESIFRSEVRNISMISMRALIFGFLGIALGLSVFRKGRK
jgi:parallel beta-helix repeat protein